MSRISCHSPFKHYEMFHGNSACCGGGGNYGSIFNTTINYGGGFGCGNFWSGLGLGFGQGFGAMLGGFFGNMMGGFGMFGMGFPMFNMFGGGWGNFWDGLGGSKSSTSTSETSTSSSSSSKKCKDADDALIKDYKEKVGDLKPTDVDEAKKLYKEIEKLSKNPKDSVHETQNKLAYDDLLKKLKEKFPNVNFDDGTVENVDNDNNDDKIPDAWNVSPLKELGAAKIKELTNIGVKPVNIGTSSDPEWTLSLPSTISKANLELLKGTGISVAVAYNGKADDKWVAGKIDNITESATGKLSYTVDCSSCKNKLYGYTYDISQNENDDNWTVAYKSGYTSADGDLYTKPNTQYKFNGSNLATNSDPVVSKHNRAGYTKLS